MLEALGVGMLLNITTDRIISYYIAGVRPLATRAITEEFDALRRDVFLLNDLQKYMYDSLLNITSDVGIV